MKYAIVKQVFYVPNKHITLTFVVGDKREYEYFQSIIPDHLLQHYIDKGIILIEDIKTKEELQRDIVNKVKMLPKTLLVNWKKIIIVIAGLIGFIASALAIIDSDAFQRLIEIL